MENIVNKLISDILLMNADVIRSNIKSIDNLQNLPADIAAEISNLLEELDYSIDEMSREAANDPELRSPAGKAHPFKGGMKGGHSRLDC